MQLTGKFPPLNWKDPMPADKLYTTPIVCKSAQGWFVFFRYWDHEQRKYKPKKISRANNQDLNRIKDLKEREAHFKALRAAKEIWLKLGWNPLKDPEFKNRFVEDILNTAEYEDIKNWSFKRALQHALTNKKLSENSKPDYRKSLDYFLKAANQQYIDILPVSRITRTHIKAVFAWLNNKTKLPAKNYNKRLNHIKSLLTELVEWNVFEQNPAHGLKELPTETTQKFVPLTDEERTMVREYLFLKNYRFFVYCISVYFTGLRPDELLSLRIKDIDLINSIIHLQPFSHTVKNKKERRVVIHAKLLSYYQKLNLNEHKPDHYIFSVKFMPGAKRIHERSAGYLWNKYVRHELGIDKYLYSLKHLGADDLIIAGADEQSVVDHLSHSSRFITRRYTQLGIEKSKQVIKNTDIEF